MITQKDAITAEVINIFIFFCTVDRTVPKKFSNTKICTIYAHTLEKKSNLFLILLPLHTFKTAATITTNNSSTTKTTTLTTTIE